ncbi:hypothetical protein NXS19_013795 [Fusarium pseudograminearum]|nr:hypothetical protein NXS19_013795 [Fusarium pseudograminearum]
MSSQQPSEMIPSQRERDLSVQLQEATSEKYLLLKQLLDAKSELFETSRQRERDLSDQLKVKVSELQAAYTRKESLEAQLEKHVANLALLKKNIDDPHAELLEKENALQASRHQERELAFELQTVKADFESYKYAEKKRVDRLTQAERDLKCSRDYANVLSSEAQQAKKAAEDAKKSAETLGEQLQQAEETMKWSKNKIADTEKELHKAKADFQVASARERGLKRKLAKNEKLLKSNRFTLGRQAPPVVFGAPSPIPRPRPIVDFSHLIPKSELTLRADFSLIKPNINGPPKENPSPFSSFGTNGQPQEKLTLFGSSTKPSTPAQSPWIPLPQLEIRQLNKDKPPTTLVTLRENSPNRYLLGFMLRNRVRKRKDSRKNNPKRVQSITSDEEDEEDDDMPFEPTPLAM